MSETGRREGPVFSAVPPKAGGAFATGGWPAAETVTPRGGLCMGVRKVRGWGFCGLRGGGEGLGMGNVDDDQSGVGEQHGA